MVHLSKFLILLFAAAWTASHGFGAEDGLVACWPMDDGEGAIIKDQSGHGLDGRIMGQGKWVEGRFGKAVELNGVDTWIDCGRDPSLNIGEKISLEMWVKLFATQGGGGIGRYGKEGGYLLTPVWRDDGKPWFFVRKSPPPTLFVAIGQAPLPLHVWHHLIATAEKGGDSRLYVNGELVAQNQLTHDFGAKPSVSMNLILGKYGESLLKGVIDEVKIYNRILTETEIMNQKAAFLSPERVAKLKTSLAELAKRSDAPNSLPPGGKAWKDDIRRMLDSTLNSLGKSEFQPANASGGITYPAAKEFQKMESTRAHLDQLITGLEKGKITNDHLLFYAVNPISGQKILPDTQFIEGDLSGAIKLAACPGEIEAGSFAVHTRISIASLKVEITDLQNGPSRIPATNIDIKSVKCWYQGGTAWADINQNKTKTLVPELLLHDDSLVRVDPVKKENHLKINGADGEKHLWISNPNEPASKEKTLSTREYAMRDSAALLPIDIPADASKQFWITVKVPAQIPPGIYAGKIRLSNPQGCKQDIDIRLRVLPFTLPPCPIISGMYYRGILDPRHSDGSVLSYIFKSEDQMKIDLENMRAHGVTNPTIHQSIANKELLGRVLRLRAEAGMDNRTLYYLGFTTGNPTTPKDLEALKNKVKEVIEFAKTRGAEEVYFYGIDEAKDEKLASQREAWKAVHDAGGKILVAGQKEKNFKAMGDIQDLLVCAFAPLKEEAARWHSAGHKIFNYANPQIGAENPEIYRRNYGLLLWKCDYDGAMDYAYQHAAGNIWNDFDDATYRDHVFAYPTIDGVIDTIAWEGYREGIDDLRYLSALQGAIKTGKQSRDEKLRQTATQAAEYLEKLDVEKGNLDTIRSEMIDFILKLKTP